MSVRNYRYARTCTTVDELADVDTGNRAETTADAARRLALDLISRGHGLRVFPIEAGKKKPLARGGTCRGADCSDRSHVHASRDPVEVGAWFSAGLASYGVRPGRVVILDEDHDGALGTLEHLAGVETPATWEVRTGSGKRHMYLALPVGVRIRGKARVVEGVDLVGESGSPWFAVGPGSVHPDTGYAYTWTRGRSPDDVALALCPPPLIAFFEANGLVLRGATPRPELASLLRAINLLLLSRLGAKQNGDEIRCHCPWHDDQNPSASWNVVRHTYFCRVCQKRGIGWKKLATKLGIAVAKQPPNLVAIEAMARVIALTRFSGRTAATDRNVLLAHLKAARDRKSLRHDLSDRQITEQLNNSRPTVAGAHRRLIEWLICHRRGRAGVSSTYTLRIPQGGGASLYHAEVLPQDSAWTSNAPRHHDAFAQRALGPCGAQLLTALEQQEWTKRALRRALGWEWRTLRRRLERAEKSGAATKTPEGLWRRGPASLDEIAKYFGTGGRLERLKGQHKRERERCQSTAGVAPATPLDLRSLSLSDPLTGERRRLDGLTQFATIAADTSFVNEALGRQQ